MTTSTKDEMPDPGLEHQSLDTDTPMDGDADVDSSRCSPPMSASMHCDAGLMEPQHGLDVLPVIVSHADIVGVLSKKIPLNEYNLPVGFYRADLLPLQGIDYRNDPSYDEELTQTLRNAFVPLSYNEGFPTLPDGRPFWTQLEFEDPTAFAVFNLYLRQEHNHLHDVAATQAIYETRQLGTLVDQAKLDGLSITLSTLKEYYQIYYWHQRVKAHDLFSVAAQKRQQELRAATVVDDHYLKANKLMRRLMIYLEDEEDFWDLMTPKVGIEFMKQLVALQRISVDLPAAGPSAEGQGAGGSSIEVLLRNISQNNATEDGNIIDHETQLTQALSDPETTELAQELIIKMNLSR